MSPPLGDKLRIRAMIYVAAEPVPLFWPMRSFISRNPLHGLAHLPFDEAVDKGADLFRARRFLPRPTYQGYLKRGLVDRDALEQGVRRFLENRPGFQPFEPSDWLLADLTGRDRPVAEELTLADADAVHAILNGTEPPPAEEPDPEVLSTELIERLLHGRPLYELVDALFGTRIGEALDEQVIRACLDFFDEGQSVWSMPHREQGLFRAWLDVAGRDVRRTLDRLLSEAGAESEQPPETVIALVLRALELPEDDWVAYFTRELARLYGWAGFIRWRSGASHYHWQQRFPGDLVDYLAMRALLALTLLRQETRERIPFTFGALSQFIASEPFEVYLRNELYGADKTHAPRVMPKMARALEDVLLQRKRSRVTRVFHSYRALKRRSEAETQARSLVELGEELGLSDRIRRASPQELDALLRLSRDFRRREGMIWLQAMETRAIGDLIQGLNLETPEPRDKRPFAKALFCIDTRSERIRRNLESVGDYQTYGIAGFFGVPLSFMELGKGIEIHLCPVLLTPKNLVVEMSSLGLPDRAALTALEKVMHELKESVLTPFVTVEAVGLLFGFDMVGKTLMPTSYNRWRERLHQSKPPTHLMIDKLGRDQADSIVRTVQRAVIAKALEQELDLPPERITDDLARELRECALGHAHAGPELAVALGLDDAGVARLLDRLRGAYRINPAFARLQMERLGRIGFSLDEQVGFVHQALRSIGLTQDFSRFILLVGHGSSSENNPYESALDCGACGGSHGLVSARALAQMANKPEVRCRLRDKGLEIPDDAWFVPALHDTTTDEIQLQDLALLPASHLMYLDRLRTGLGSASRLCAQERLPTLEPNARIRDAAAAARGARRNARDWSQVRPEWGLSRNAYFVIGRRELTQSKMLDGRAFLHSYDYRLDPRRRLLENILTGPLVVGHWINMEYYFSTVDNDRFGSGSKVYHNVAGRFGVMSGNLSDLRTGLPAQTVLEDGRPYHQPMRLVTLIEAPFAHAIAAVEGVVAVKRLVRNGWIRLLVLDPEASTLHLYEDGEWRSQPYSDGMHPSLFEEVSKS
ncbi:DUF2309 domain-containing protein [Imhoffiella purpurea]|uniref:Probable inorganic carbon transporter subunit DabA n=1 Tax=Imhoffiella purpurea TaxID=1249627 RepID=W9V6Y6_9GAMM|nr:DUF2309 domain-containing protein [Imhoffiella purpurea]EXJ15179.1 Putative transmembrane protein [Imhoffiella purpurea]